MTTRLPFPAYLEHLRRDSTRFVEVLADADPAAAVPSCPEWTAADLLHHLTGVQWFWGTVVADRLTDTEEVEALHEPEREPSYPAMLDAMRSATRTLAAALEANGPDAAAWTWADDQTAGFICRRQAHEALIHRVDAELAAGIPRAGLDPVLATDGVDEALRIMHGWVPWATVTSYPQRRIRIRATDTGASWLVTLARITGTDEEGTVHDEDGIEVLDDDGKQVLADMHGAAADLDCWLWHRQARTEPTSSGDPEVLAALRAVLSGSQD